MTYYGTPSVSAGGGTGRAANTCCEAKVLSARKETFI